MGCGYACACSGCGRCMEKTELRPARCFICGTDNPPGAVRCSSCGHSLPGTPGAPRTAEGGTGQKPGACG